MAKVGAQRAAELTGRSKSTIQRSMNNGKLSYEVDNNGRRVIDVSELDRAFGLQQQSAGMAQDSGKTVEAELEKATMMLDMERLKMRVRMLEDQLEAANAQIEDIRGQRDQWQKQASQMMITSQTSQKQADELRAELKERDRRMQLRRQKKLEQRMRLMQAQNQNAQDAPEQAQASGFHGLWKRVKGQR